MQANAEIFFEHDQWSRNLAWSAGLHVAVVLAIIGYAVLAPSHTGSGWGAGGGGDAMGVTLVSTIPLPSQPAATQNVLANDSKGLTQSKPKEEVKELDAIPIADKDAKKKPSKKRPLRTRRSPKRLRKRTTSSPTGKAVR